MQGLEWLEANPIHAGSSLEFYRHLLLKPWEIKTLVVVKDMSDTTINIVDGILKVPFCEDTIGLMSWCRSRHITIEIEKGVQYMANESDSEGAEWE